MSLRAASFMAVACAACAASPLAAAEIPDSRAAGLRGPVLAGPDLAGPASVALAAQPPAPLAVPDDHPRRYSLHRDYGEQPDPTVLPPEFFLQSTPVETEPAPSPLRDRHGRPLETPAPDSPSA